MARNLPHPLPRVEDFCAASELLEPLPLVSKLLEPRPLVSRWASLFPVSEILLCNPQRVLVSSTFWSVLYFFFDLLVGLSFRFTDAQILLPLIVQLSMVLFQISKFYTSPFLWCAKIAFPTHTHTCTDRIYTVVYTITVSHVCNLCTLIVSFLYCD